MSDFVADELQIRSLVARYSDAVNRRDDAQWADTFAEDGQWTLFGQTRRGREEMRKWFAELVGGLDWVVQLVNSGTIEIEGDRARGRWYLTELNRRGDSGGLIVGVYHDRYVRADGEWRFSSRRFDPLYVGPPDLSSNGLPFPVIDETEG